MKLEDRAILIIRGPRRNASHRVGPVNKFPATQTARAVHGIDRNSSSAKDIKDGNTRKVTIECKPVQ